MTDREPFFTSGNVNEASSRREGVVFGAGSVGRGFIGQLLSEAGWQVTFIDLDETLISRLNQDGGYTHVTVSRQGNVQMRVSPVTAISALNRDEVTSAVSRADLVVTCVGAGALGSVVKAMTQGILDRITADREPLNIMLAENLNQAASHVRNLLSPGLAEIDPIVVDKRVGLVETSIGRMIPEVLTEIQNQDPTIIFAEPYRTLPFDVAAWRGSVPHIPGLSCDPDVDFTFYVERKLYVHNMGHLLCGLLAEAIGTNQLSEAIRHPVISALTRAAMLESAQALAARHQVSPDDLVSHVDDLIDRFNNPALGDTTARVTRDLGRKMAPDDRMIGAFRTAVTAGVPSGHISLGVALGLYRLSRAEQIEISDPVSWLRKHLTDMGIVLDRRTGLLLQTQFESLIIKGFHLDQQAEMISLGQ